MTVMIQVKVMPLKELLDPQGKAVMQRVGLLPACQRRDGLEMRVEIY